MQNLGGVTQPKDVATKEYVDNATSGKQAKITASGVLKGDGSGGVSAATAGTDYQIPVASTDVSAAGVISYKDANNNTLFTVQLPLYNGGVST